MDNEVQNNENTSAQNENVSENSASQNDNIEIEVEKQDSSENTPDPELNAENSEGTAEPQEASPDAGDNSQPSQSSGSVQPPSGPQSPPVYTIPTTAQHKKRKCPTWVIVLICVIGALYLIVSASLIAFFVFHAAPGSLFKNLPSNGAVIPEEQVEEHLTITDSPKSEGAKTTNGALTVKQISEKVRASVVGVTCKSLSDFASASVGSGIIMSDDGYIITNNHVIEGMTTISVVLDNGENYEARLIGADTRSDLAVIKIEASGLSAAEFGDSDKLEQGDPAIAIGNPAGLQLQNTVTSGIISAINRDIVIDDRTMTLIQTDASINPGNSGGPLVNEFGQVIGINTVKIGVSYYEGLGFAIPMNTAKPIVDELITRGYIKGRPSIGISGTTISERDAAFYNLPAGMYIEYVHPNSDAAKKGLRRGDIITKMNGTRLSSSAEIKKIRDNFKAGDTVTLTIYRNSEEVDIDIVLMDEAVLSNAGEPN